MRASTQKYKDANSNYKVKVSSATVAKLKKGTKASNIAAANMAGASAEYKEAVRRFYGKNAIKSTTVNTPNQKENRPPRVPTANDREGRGTKVTGSSSTKKTTTAGTSSKRVNKPLINLPKAVGNSQAKLDKKAAANKILLAEQKKKRLANANKNGMK